MRTSRVRAGGTPRDARARCGTRQWLRAPGACSRSAAARACRTCARAGATAVGSGQTRRLFGWTCPRAIRRIMPASDTPQSAGLQRALGGGRHPSRTLDSGSLRRFASNSRPIVIAWRAPPRSWRPPLCHSRRATFAFAWLDRDRRPYASIPPSPPSLTMASITRAQSAPPVGAPRAMQSDRAVLPWERHPTRGNADPSRGNAT